MEGTVSARTEPPGETEPDRPHPPRFRWLRRITVGCAAIALALTMLRAGWGWEADRRLRRALDSIAARREPHRVADPFIPGEQNAATWLIRAAAAVDPDADCPSSTGNTFPDDRGSSPLWRQLADASVAASPRAFALARRTRAFDRSAWDDPRKHSRGPSIFAPLPNHPLLPIHHLANTVSDAALDMHVHGDDVAALEAIRDTRHLARAVGTYPGGAGPTVSRNHDSIAAYKLQIIAAGLPVAPEGALPANPDTAIPAPNPPVRPARRGQVRLLIRELLDESEWEDDLPRGLAVEQAAKLEAGEWAARTTRLLRPMVWLDLARLLDKEQAGIDAASQRSWPAARTLLERAGRLPAPTPAINYYPSALPPPKRPAPVDHAHLLSRSDLLGSVDRAVLMDHRVRAQRRAAALSLAAQLYRADHGNWPPELAALAPQYLPALPLDPFSPEGAPFRYVVVRHGLPDGGDRPLVYSVGENGVVDTGDTADLKTIAPQYGWTRWRDVYTDLAQWTASPATMPVTAPSPG